MIIKKLIQKEIKEKLNELKLQDLIKQLNQQKSINFYHHNDHVNFMHNETGVYPVFKEFKNGILHFTHDSSEEWKETENNKYNMYIKFYEWKNLLTMAQEGKSSKEITDVLYSGDLGIFCDCHSFWYHYSYPVTKKGAYIVFQKIPSPIKNPELTGVACKHLDGVLNQSALKFNYNLVKKEISNFQNNIASKAANKILGKEQDNSQSNQENIENDSDTNL